MKRTTAVGSVANAFVDKVASPFSPGTTIGAEDMNQHQEELAHVVEGANIALSGGDTSQLLKAIKKLTKELRHEVGELFPMLDYKAPVAWADNPDAYFPGICLSNLAAPLVLNLSNYPDLVPYLRAYKSTYARGMAGEISDYSVTNWAISANVATLTLASNASVNAILAAMVEEMNVNGSFAVPITVPAIGNIAAGDYIPTAIDTVNRLVTFACVGTTGSGAVSTTIAVMPFRVVGQASQARIFPMQGMSLVSANDANAYHIGGLRRRGFMQGHKHTVTGYNGGSGGSTITSGTATILYSSQDLIPMSDGTNGPPLIAKVTEGPSLTGHWYIHAGRAS